MVDPLCRAGDGVKQPLSCRGGALATRTASSVAACCMGSARPAPPADPARIRAFVDQALPQVRPQVGAQLLIQLADHVDLEVDLRAWSRDQVLWRAVDAVHLNR